MLRLLCPLLSSLSFAVSSPVFSQKSDKNPGFDINDVAVLFPLDANDRPWPFLTLDESRERASEESELLGDSIFSDLLGKATELWISAPLQSSILKATDWAVVGFRYDPCAPSNAGNSICLQELRLIAQAMGKGGPSDSAMHIIYELGHGPLRADDTVVQDLARLKKEAESLLGESSSGHPLGPHPLLRKAVQANRPAVGELYKNFILRQARSSRLTKLTMMGLRDGSPTDWIFFGGDVKDGRWISAQIPNLDAGEAVELDLSKGFDSFQPQPRNPALSTHGFFSSEPAALDAARETLSAAIHRLESPDFSNRNSADCLSCHTATTLRLSPSLKIPQFIDGISPATPQGITAFPAPMALQSHPLHWNLRAFGYFGIMPALNMRVVHEAGRIAEQLNRLLGREAPGPDCSADPRKVMLCFVQSSVPFGQGASTEECLKSCRSN